MAVKEQEINDKYAIFNGDCIDVMSEFSDESIHMSIYSPPFAGLYQYSSDEKDLSNSRNYQEFLDHYDFLISEIYRVTMPGRMTLVHCMDIPLSNSGKGDNMMDFPGDIIHLHTKCRNENCTASDLDRRKGSCGHGWFGYNARYHIWKEPLTVRNRTMKKSLAHKTIVDDSSKCSVASADYLLGFRKLGVNPVPITHPVGLLEYAGERQIPENLWQYRGWTGKQTENRFSHWIWRQYADAFWDDIRLDRVLKYKAPNRRKLNEDDEKHVHPLQLDVIDRAVVLWSNEGEKVLTPFMGVGSEVYSAVANGRMGIGIELKSAYYNQAVKNVEDALNNQYEPLPLFALAGVK